MPRNYASVHAHAHTHTHTQTQTSTSNNDFKIQHMKHSYIALSVFLFWVAMSHGLVGRYQHFRETFVSPKTLVSTVTARYL
jgi:hypothetical protein